MSTHETEVPTHVVHHHHFIHNNTGVTFGGGNGSTTSTTPPAPLMVGRQFTSGGLYVPWWLSEAFAVFTTILGIMLLVTVGALIWSNWPFGSSNQPAPAGMTMPQLLASEHFAIDHHALCGFDVVAGGTAYKLYLNRGGTCRHTVQTIVGAKKVGNNIGPHYKRSSITFVYNPVRLKPDQVRKLKTHALGEQVLRNLNHIVARAKK